MKASIRPRVTERQRDAIKKLAHEQTVKEIGGITRRNYKLIMIALNESFGFGAGRLSRRGKMAEYIEREATLRELESLGITKNMKAHRKINTIPAADVVEVVRCKNCAFWDGDGRCDPRHNGLTVEYTDPYDYCSYGKRKDGGENGE